MKEKDKEFTVEDLNQLGKTEKAAILEIFQTISTLKGFDVTVYQSIKDLFSKDDYSDNNAQQILRMNTIKLTIIFGSVKEADAYLKRFNPKSPYSYQTMHDACLFFLPEGNAWSVKTWRKFIIENKPSGSRDLIMRLLPFLPKIEHYIKTHEEDVKAQIRKNVEGKFENEYSQEYAILATVDSFCADFLTKNSKKIEKEIKLAINNYLGIPERRKPTEEENKEIDRKRTEDSAELITIEEKIRQNHKEIAQEEYAKKSQDKPEKEDYIAACLKVDAGIIDATVNKSYHELKTSLKVPIADLASYVKNVFYKNAEKNPHAAHIFFKLGMPEECFEQYLTLTPKDDDTLVPNVLILGTEIHPNYSKFYIKKMDSHDPLAAGLGIVTGCCQSLGGLGSACTVYGVTKANSGFYVLYQMKGDAPGPKDIVIAQSWTSRDDSNQLLYDSAESPLEFRKKYKTMIADFYTYLSYELAHKYGIQRIQIGKGGQTPGNLGVIEAAIPVILTDHDGYQDSKIQRIVYDKNLPIMDMYKALNPDSLLDFSKLITIPTKKGLLEWADLCALQRMVDRVDVIWAKNRKFKVKEKLDPIENLKFCTPYLKSLHLNDVFLSDRYFLTQRWISLLIDYTDPTLLMADKRAHMTAQRIQPDYKEVRKYIEKGIDLNIPGPYSWGGFSLTRGALILPLFAVLGDKKAVSDLIKHGAKINIPARDGTALEAAASSGQAELFQYLLEKGGNPKYPPRASDIFLNTAVEANSTKMLELLLSMGVVVEKDSEALHTAVETRNKKFFTLLLTACPDYDFQTKYSLGDRTLLESVVFAGDVEMAQYLLDNHINIGDPLPIICSQLRQLSSEGKGGYHNECFKFYSSKVVPLINILDQAGFTIELAPLKEIAFKTQCLPLIKWFYSQAFKLPLEAFNHYATLAELDSFLAQRGLITQNVSSEAVLPKKSLYYAVDVGSISLVRTYLAQGLDPNEALPAEENYPSLLHFALHKLEGDKYDQQNRLPIIRELIWMGAKADNINVKMYPVVIQALEVIALVKQLPQKSYLNIADILLSLLNGYMSVGNYVYTSSESRACATMLIDYIKNKKLHTLLPASNWYDYHRKGLFDLIEKQLREEHLKPYGSYKGLLLYLTNDNTLGNLIEEKIGIESPQMPSTAALLSQHGKFKPGSGGKDDDRPTITTTPNGT